MGTYMLLSFINFLKFLEYFLRRLPIILQSFSQKVPIFKSFCLIIRKNFDIEGFLFNREL